MNSGLYHFGCYMLHVSSIRNIEERQIMNNKSMSFIFISDISPANVSSDKNINHVNKINYKMILEYSFS